MRMPQTPLLPPNTIPSPIDRNPPLRELKPQQLEQLRVNINTLLVAPHARVHDFDIRDRLATVWVIDGDGGTTEGVAVGVGAVVHFQVRDGDDVFARGGGYVAG